MTRQRSQNQRTMVAADKDALSNPLRVGRVGDKDGYISRARFATVLRVAWDVAFMSRSQYYQHSSQLIDGDNVSIDKTHTLVKGIRVNTS